MHLLDVVIKHSQRRVAASAEQPAKALRATFLTATELAAVIVVFAPAAPISCSWLVSTTRCAASGGERLVLVGRQTRPLERTLQSFMLVGSLLVSHF